MHFAKLFLSLIGLAVSIEACQCRFDNGDSHSDTTKHCCGESGGSFQGVDCKSPDTGDFFSCCNDAGLKSDCST